METLTELLTTGGIMFKKLLKKKEEKSTKPFVPNKRVSEKPLTDQEKMNVGFNGSTYSLNGRDIDF